MPLLYGICGCRWGSVVVSVGSLNGSERGHHGILCGGAYLKALLLLLLFSKGSSLFILLCVLCVSPLPRSVYPGISTNCRLHAMTMNGTGDRKRMKRARDNRKIHFCFRCCRVCAKAVGEACGGPGGFSGTCEPPLQCVQRLQMKGSGVCLGGYP